jgi:hypothetical protein
MSFETWNKIGNMACVEGLGILALPWIPQFLDAMNLPERIFHDSNLWHDLYFDTQEKSCLLKQLPDKSRIDELHRALWQGTLMRLCWETDVETVNALCEWLYRHFQNTPLENDLWQWQRLFWQVLWPSEKKAPHIIYPPKFEELGLQMVDLFWHQQEKIRESLLQIPLTYQISSEGDPDVMGIRQSMIAQALETGIAGDSEGNPVGDAGVVYKIIARELTIKAVRLINVAPDGEMLMEWLNKIATTVCNYEYLFSDAATLMLYDANK